jgi:hypothetical protein
LGNKSVFVLPLSFSSLAQSSPKDLSGSFVVTLISATNKATRGIHYSKYDRKKKDSDADADAGALQSVTVINRQACSSNTGATATASASL